MSGVELILAALAAAATATVTTGLQDVYGGLKMLLIRRLSGRDRAVAALEAREATREVWEARLGDDLRATGADTDEQVLAAARAVLVQADPAGSRAGNYVVTTNHGAVGQFHAPVTFHQGVPVPPSSPGTV